MNIQVFDKDEAKERQIYFKLIPFYQGISLCVVDSIGNTVAGGIVLSITQDGKLLPHIALNPDVGLSVVNDGIEILPACLPGAEGRESLARSTLLQTERVNAKLGRITPMRVKWEYWAAHHWGHSIDRRTHHSNDMYVENLEEAMKKSQDLQRTLGDNLILVEVVIRIYRDTES
jgi:hypothetical protein